MLYITSSPLTIFKSQGMAVRHLTAVALSGIKGTKVMSIALFLLHLCDDSCDIGVLTSDHSGFPVDEQNKLLPSDLSESEKYGKKIGGVILDNVSLLVHYTPAPSIRTFYRSLEEDWWIRSPLAASL